MYIAMQNETRANSIHGWHVTMLTYIYIYIYIYIPICAEMHMPCCDRVLSSST
jgi:hypothetical protein